MAKRVQKIYVKGQLPKWITPPPPALTPAYRWHGRQSRRHVGRLGHVGKPSAASPSSAATEGRTGRLESKAKKAATASTATSGMDPEEYTGEEQDEHGAEQRRLRVCARLGSTLESYNPYMRKFTPLFVRDATLRKRH
ncbi:hypothetical protein B0H17DRAFT_1341771 [Mycena rosella]|uniref:Uncharacterized protein n=1 Tax=Mycena rosella TaxID=1033263 RepID=A0AAD7F7G7_MYCRO|nr:hypothetical protein B0H17DRAFT_1341771 [Mycena rosella]